MPHMQSSWHQHHCKKIVQTEQLVRAKPSQSRDCSIEFLQFSHTHKELDLDYLFTVRRPKAKLRFHFYLNCDRASRQMISAFWSRLEQQES
jgi:hypothetical protein